MKKILLIHTHGGIGGAGQSLLDIVNVLKNTSFCFDVACPMHPDTMIGELKHIGVNVIPLKKSLVPLPNYNGSSISKINFRYWIYFFKIILCGKKQLKEINLYKYDIIFINSTIHSWITRFLTKKQDCYCFFRESYMGSIKSLRNRILLHDLSRCKGIAFISNYDLKRTKLKSKTTKKYLIPDAVDIDKFYSGKKTISNIKMDDVSRYVLFVGGHNWIKGGNVIVKAMQYIDDKNVKLIFMPSDNDNTHNLKSYLNPCSKYNIDRFVKKYMLKNRIVFLPSQIDMTPFYNLASIVVFPSVVAHQARPIYESGACHKTIIVTDFEETKEYLIDGFNGLVFKKNNSKMLGILLNKIMNNKDMLDKLGENNYKMTVRYHNMKKYSEQIKNFVYDSIGYF